MFNVQSYVTSTSKSFSEYNAEFNLYYW